jgi:hypothetical protein
MPQLPNQPQVLRYDAVWSIGTDTDIKTRLFFTYSGPAPTSAVADSFAQTAAQEAAIQAPQYMPSTHLFDRVDVQDLTSPTSASGTYAQQAAGIRTGTQLGAGACVLVNHAIARRYRGGKPRSYWPFGVGEDLASPQTWSSAFLTQVRAFINAYAGAIEGSSSGGTAISQWVNVSYYEGFTSVVNPVTGRTRDVPKVRATAIPPDQITGFTVNTRVGSQRRRITA